MVGSTLIGSCKQLPLLAFLMNPQFFPLVLPCSVPAMSMSSPSLVNTQGGFEDSFVITLVVDSRIMVLISSKLWNESTPQ